MVWVFGRVAWTSALLTDTDLAGFLLM
jgi:hypothetical protein